MHGGYHMSVDKHIAELLQQVLVPGVRRSLFQMNLVRDIAIEDNKAKISLSLTALSPQAQDWIKNKVIAAIQSIPEIQDVTVNFVEAKPNELNKIKKIIAVMSGKGGVGKSLMAGLLALSLVLEGKEVGILDADITGPSIPKMFGLNEHPGGNKGGILPVLSKTGIEIMSMNLLLPSEDDAVIWRGPLMAKAITQFWEEVLWGELDYLIIDVPPGTGDIPLTLMQTIPLTGVIDVFTPQDLTEMIVMKAIKMADKMNIRVLGVIENMSFLILPETGQKMEIFGKSKGEEMAKKAGAPLLGQLPIDPELAKLCDEGIIEQYRSDFLSSISANLLSVLKDKV
jgi:Mrp family chromosome partitioning ATPase